MSPKISRLHIWRRQRRAAREDEDGTLFTSWVAAVGGDKKEQDHIDATEYVCRYTQTQVVSKYHSSLVQTDTVKCTTTASYVLHVAKLVSPIPDLVGPPTRVSTDISWTKGSF